MVKFVNALEVEIDNGNKEGVIMVLEDILDYAITEVDGDLIQRTIEMIHIMKEEN